MSLPDSKSRVEEFHGYYGPYVVRELLLQRIWLEGAFDGQGLVDQWGRSVVIEAAGEWNRLEGPDFRNARLRFDGELVEGDVEVHFSQEDWRRHGHGEDARYDRVILHVVYFPLRGGELEACTSKGLALPVVSLMAHLWYDLEEYADDDSIVASAGTWAKPALDELLALDEASRRDALVSKAKERWDLKLHFAGQRLAKLGWEGACHQTAMEVMGYARNRIPMLMVASRFGLAELRARSMDVDALWQAGEGKWRTNGCRPANHPWLRLRQYLDWSRAKKDWTRSLLELAEQLDGSADGCFGCRAEYGFVSKRKAVGVADFSRRLDDKVLGGKVGGAKRATLVCDGFLPLLSQASGRDAFALWFHWHAGDGPDSCVDELKRLQILQPHLIPMSNGWLQGALALRNRVGV